MDSFMVGVSFIGTKVIGSEKLLGISERSEKMSL